MGCKGHFGPQAQFSGWNIADKKLDNTWAAGH